MLNFETVARLVVVVVAFAGSTALAGETITLPSQAADCSSYNNSVLAIMAESDSAPAEKQKGIQRRLDVAQRAYDTCTKNSITSGNDCLNASSDFRKDVQDFQAACSKAGISSTDCAKEISKCEQTNDDSSDDSDSKTSSRKPLDVDGVYKMCPALARADQKDFEKQLKDQQDRVDKLEKEMPDLKKQVDDLDKDQNKQIQEMTDQATKDAADHSKELKELSNNKDTSIKAITDQLAGIQTQISKANDALAQVQEHKLTNKLSLAAAKREAQLNCYKTAADEVTKMQGDVINATMAGKYNVGSFTTLMKRVGVSDRQQWQRVMNKYYQWCLASKPTMDTMTGANDVYTDAVAKDVVNENSARQQIDDLQKSQLALANPAGCQAQTAGGVVAETSMCQAVRQANEAMQQSEADYRSKQQAGQQKYYSLVQLTAKQKQTIQDQITKKQTDLDAENDRLTNLQEFLQAKRDRGGGSKATDSKDVDDALGKLVVAQSEAMHVVGCTREKSKDAPGEFCRGDSSCNLAQSFLIKTKAPVTSDDDYRATTNPIIKAPPIVTTAGGSAAPSTPPPDDTSTGGAAN
jgi:hypothetical protein